MQAAGFEMFRYRVYSYMGHLLDKRKLLLSVYLCTQIRQKYSIAMLQFFVNFKILSILFKILL